VTVLNAASIHRASDVTFPLSCLAPWSGAKAPTSESCADGGTLG
jgi:hypothetical protein